MIRRTALLSLLAGLCLHPGAGGTAQARDITAYVKKHTFLDQAVALVCLQRCQGNQREGKLDFIRVQPGAGDRYAVTGGARLRSRHVTGLGGAKLVAYDYTVQVRANGSLDPASCKLHVERVWVENDRLGLTALARREEGKVHPVPNCRDLIAEAENRTPQARQPPARR